MKVLVTGGGGFLGSHICEFSLKSGWEVTSVDNLTKFEFKRTEYLKSDKIRVYNWDFLKRLGVHLVQGDISNLSDLTEAAKECDFITHTAAQPAMTLSIETPEIDLRTNVIGTFNVLETARKLDIPVVSCSTIHVYGTGINETLKEGETRYIRTPAEISEEEKIMTGVLTPLHASKRSAEIYTQVYHDTYGLDTATFRLTGMYGPRQFGGEDHGWVANFIIRTILNLPINVFGTGKQVRDILYATDAAKAFWAFYKSKKSGVYNIGGGPNNMLSLVECLKMIEEITGRKQNIEFKESRIGDLQYFVCDISKAKKELSWNPKVLPREGIEKMVRWVEENLEIFKA